VALAYLLLWMPEAPPVTASVKGQEAAAPVAEPPVTSAAPVREPSGVDVETPGVADLARSGTLQLLDAATREPVCTAKLQLWRSEVEGDVATELESDARGQVSLAEGRWRVRLHAALEDHTFEIVADQTTVVWTAVGSPCTISVHAPGGRAVAGAMVRWRVRPNGGDGLEVERGRWGPSDTTGKVQLGDWEGGIGRFVVTAGGFEPASVMIRGRPEQSLVVFLWPTSSAVTTVKCLKAPGMTPAPAVTFRVDKDRELTSDQSGQILVPSEWESPSPVTVESSEWWGLPGLAIERGQDIIVFPRSRLVARLLGDWRGNVSWWAVADGLGVIASGTARSGSLEFTAAIPQGVSISVEANDSLGFGSRRSVQASSDATFVQLERSADDADALEIEVAASRQCSPRAVVLYRGDKPKIEVAAVGNRIRVPFASDVLAIDIDAPGFATTRIKPNRSHTGGAAGVLKIDLKEQVAANVRIVAEGSGKPLVGMHVGLWSAASGIREFPDLNGGWPSNHPHWTVVRPLAVTANTDAMGRVGRPIPTGNYEVEVSTPNLQGQGGTYFSLYPRLRFPAEIASSSELLLTVPAPRLVNLSVVDAITGWPVASVRVFCGSMSDPGNVKGNLWQGWVDSHAKELRVVVPDVGSRTVPLPDGEEPWSARIEIESRGVGVLLVQGPAELDGRKLEIDVARQAEGAWMLVGSFDAVLRDGRVPVALPWSSGVSVSVRLAEATGKGFKFEPERVPWTTGAVLTFEAKR
jgi:hypothetical protein